MERLWARREPERASPLRLWVVIAGVEGRQVQEKGRGRVRDQPQQKKIRRQARRLPFISKGVSSFEILRAHNK